MDALTQPDATPQRRRGWAHRLRLVGGWLLLIACSAGFVLPIIPGIPLVIAGLAALSCEYVWAKRLHGRALEYWKKLKGAD